MLLTKHGTLKMTDSPNEETKYKLLLKLKGLSESSAITFPLILEYKHGEVTKVSTVNEVPASQGGFKFSDCILAKETLRYTKNDTITLTVKTPVRDPIGQLFSHIQSQTLCKHSLDLTLYNDKVAPGKPVTFAIEKPFTTGSGKVRLTVIVLIFPSGFLVSGIITSRPNKREQP